MLIKATPVKTILGVLIEGIGCVLAGLWGSGAGTTSYSENIGVIAVTKVIIYPDSQFLNCSELLLIVDRLFFMCISHIQAFSLI